MTFRDCFVGSIIFAAIAGLLAVLLGQYERNLFMLIGGIGELLFAIFGLLFYFIADYSWRNRR